MKGLPSAAPSSPFKMIIIIVNGIVYFLEVPKAVLQGRGFKTKIFDKNYKSPRPSLGHVEKSHPAAQNSLHIFCN